MTGCQYSKNGKFHDVHLENCPRESRFIISAYELIPEKHCKSCTCHKSDLKLISYSENYYVCAEHRMFATMALEKYGRRITEVRQCFVINE